MLLRKKGSLVLSLMASGAVAATIMATHQVAQNFASGAVQGLSQQHAFVQAQKAIILATLMINKNVIVCSNVQIKDRLGGWEKQVKGCYKSTPLARENLNGRTAVTGAVNKQAWDFYTKLRLGDAYPGNGVSWFKNIDLNFNQMEGKKALVFNQFKKNEDLENENHPVFGYSEITWAVRNTNDPTIRSALSYTDRGVVCRNKMLLETKGYCPPKSDASKNPLDIKYGLEAHNVEAEGLKCKETPTGSEIPGTWCDYYPVQDNDESVIFISVVVPYKESDNGIKQKLVMNAAVRRPLSIFHLRPTVAETCSMKCESAVGEHYNNKYPRCVGLSDYQSGQGFSTLDLKDYPEGVQLIKSEMKVVNKGPGILFDINLKREDMDSEKNTHLGARIVKARQFGRQGPVGPGGIRTIQDLIPCYYSSYYEVNAKHISCRCQRNLDPSGRPVAGTTGVKMANGDICYGTPLGCTEVVDSPNVLVADERNLSCPDVSSQRLSFLANSRTTRFQFTCPRGSRNCRTGGQRVASCTTAQLSEPGSSNSAPTPTPLLGNIIGDPTSSFVSGSR